LEERWGQMVLARPHTLTQNKEKKTFNRLGEPTTKTVRVSDEMPALWVDATEVTVGQFKKFLAETDHPFDGDLWGQVYEYSPTDKHPMIKVSWHDATAYAKWAGKRLPTEKEWEWAARGGLKGKEYPWGDQAPSSSRANYGFKVGKPTPVGSYPANGYGLFDMSGNVCEWCLDAWDSEYYRKSPAVDNPLSGHDSIEALINNYVELSRLRVLRGGTWYGDSDNLRVAYRDNYGPDGRAPSDFGVW